MFIRWVITAIFALFSVLVIVANAQLLWRKTQGKDANVSFVAVTGPICAIVAVLAWPSANPLKFLLLVPAVALDVGSNPLIIHAVAFLFRRKC